MKSDYQLHRYKKPDREQVFSFLREVHPPEISARIINQWDWKYDSNPFNHHTEPYILLLKDGQKIIGLEGVIFLRIYVNGRKFWIPSACNLVVHPDYRGQKLSEFIIGQLITDNPITIAWTNKISNRAAASLTPDFSFRLSPLLKIIDFDQIFDHVIGNRILSRMGSIFVNCLVRIPRVIQRERNPFAVTVSEMDTFDESANDLWRKVRDDYSVLIMRDFQYLKWRYLERPDAKYVIIGATKGLNLVGYMILRIERINDLKIGYLVDFLVERRSNAIFRLLIKKALTHFKKEGAALIVCRTTTVFCRRVLYSKGFLPWHWGPEGFFLPRVCRPDKSMQIPQDVQALRNRNRWFLTMGDGDLEMSF